MVDIDLEWHTKNSDEVLKILKSSKSGLSNAEAERRLQQYGCNDVPLFESQSSFNRFIRQFNNILIYVLLISALFTVFFNYWTDTIVIIAVVILSVISGFIQDERAERALQKIRNMLLTRASVMRDGKHCIIQAKNLVPGDIVFIKRGDKVSADIRLLNEKNLQVEESILTGESNSVEKKASVTIHAKASLGDRSNMVYNGTTVAYGNGSGVVVSTGLNTEFGKIGLLLKNVQTTTTPLLRQINIFSRWLAIAIIFLSIITFLVGIFIWNYSFRETFMSAVGITVAAIPESLPAVITIILSIGVARMAKRNAIVRWLPSVETMGCITTICSDKTGTITCNEQRIKNIITCKNFYDLETSNINFDDLYPAITAALLCNDVKFSKVQNSSTWNVEGNPIDKALFDLCVQAGVDPEKVQKNNPRVDFVPYETENKLMATLNYNNSFPLDERIVYVKGAPEKILEMCSSEEHENRPISLDYWEENIKNLTSNGYRVLAVASKKVHLNKNYLSADDFSKDLTLLAVFGLIDPPSKEALEAIKECHKAGIKVKMITGDHADTAATIAKQSNIENASSVLTGKDVDNMSDNDLSIMAQNVNVFARTSPYHKLRLVKALQSTGELVAVTGDGVNDAPALRQADIGIAMGKRGAEIAKESSDIVLADDNFATIVGAIEEGRVIYDNIKKILLLLLPNNFAEALVLMISIIFGLVLPIIPEQILWINMITAITLAIPLGFEPAEKSFMNQQPRKLHSSIFSFNMTFHTIFVSLLLEFCVLGLFLAELNSNANTSVARTAAANMLVFGEIVHLLHCRKIYSVEWNIKKLFSSKLIVLAIVITIILQLLFTYLPALQYVLGTSSLSLSHWFYIFGLSLVIFFILGAEKYFLNRFNQVA